MEDKVVIIPKRIKLFRTVNVVFLLGLALMIISIAMYLIGMLDFIKSNETLNGIFSSSIIKILFLVSIAMVSIFVYVRLRILKKPKFDDWMSQIASKRIGTNKILYEKGNLLLEYDISINTKTIKDLVRELSDKSVNYTYYFNGTSINDGVASVTPTKKQDIPTRGVIDIDEDKIWNIIPMGEAVNHKDKTVSPIAWYLNDNQKNEKVIESIPSTSLLISGGTGSGKSVLQEVIVGHVSRHSEHFQFFGIDVKRVEFKKFIGAKGIKKIALTVDEGADVLGQARDIMYDRFKFMEENDVNNIYKLETEVDFYSFNGKGYQFDEIFSIEVNGESRAMIIADIYKMMEEKGCNLIADDIEVRIEEITVSKKTYLPKAIMVMVDEMSEVMANAPMKRGAPDIRESLGSIARLGRAAGVHLVLATQRPSGNVINADLKNNIQLSVILGDFDASTSLLVFDADVSDMAKPLIKGRGFIKSGKEINEFQSYYTDPDADFEYDERFIIYKMKFEDVEDDSKNSSPFGGPKPPGRPKPAASPKPPEPKSAGFVSDTIGIKSDVKKSDESKTPAGTEESSMSRLERLEKLAKKELEEEKLEMEGKEPIDPSSNPSSKPKENEGEKSIEEIIAEAKLEMAKINEEKNLSSNKSEKDKWEEDLYQYKPNKESTGEVKEIDEVKIDTINNDNLSSEPQINNNEVDNFVNSDVEFDSFTQNNDNGYGYDNVNNDINTNNHDYSSININANDTVNNKFNINTDHDNTEYDTGNIDTEYGSTEYINTEHADQSYTEPKGIKININKGNSNNINLPKININKDNETIDIGKKEGFKLNINNKSSDHKKINTSNIKININKK